jgi:uncharacterized protein
MRWLALFVIRLYQRTISRVLPPSCRFVPSCSEYGYEAIARYGVIRGGAMAIWRVLRCNPWGGHGYDPVPDVTKRAGQQTEGESRGSRETDPLAPNSEPRTPNSFTALTPHAPGHSLTEG